MKIIELEDWQVKNLREYFGKNDNTQTSHWAFPIFDKAHKNKLTIPVVMPQLLCIDDSDFLWITKHKKYILITEDNGDYIIRDDEDDIVGVPKKTL